VSQDVAHSGFVELAYPGRAHAGSHDGQLGIGGGDRGVLNGIEIFTPLLELLCRTLLVAQKTRQTGASEINSWSSAARRKAARVAGALTTMI